MLLKAFPPPFPRENCLPLAVGQQAALWHHLFSNLRLSCVHLTDSRSALLTTRFGTKASSALLWPLRRIPLSCPSARGFHIRPQMTYRPFLHPPTIAYLLFQAFVPQVIWFLPISMLFSHHSPHQENHFPSLYLSRFLIALQDPMKNPPSPWHIPGLLHLQLLALLWIPIAPALLALRDKSLPYNDVELLSFIITIINFPVYRLLMQILSLFFVFLSD